MIVECDETSRPSTRQSNRIMSSNKLNHPKSSKTHHNPSINKNDLRKFDIEELSNEDFENILKTEVLRNNFQSVNKDRYYIKNMNLYHHIISNTQSTESNLDWILDLRTQTDSGFVIQDTKKIRCIEPSFYKRDLEKLAQKKSLERKIKEPISMKENVQSIDHIIKSRLGEKANIHQVNFELNLRKYEMRKNQRKNINKKNDLNGKGKSEFLKDLDENETLKKWNQIPFIPKSKLFSSYIENKKFNKNEISLNNENILDKETQTKENKSNNVNIQKTKTQISTDNHKFGLIDEFLGENRSMKPYTEKYKVKNAASIQHMLKKGTNSQALFQSGLRDY